MLRPHLGAGLNNEGNSNQHGEGLQCHFLTPPPPSNSSGLVASVSPLQIAVSCRGNTGRSIHPSIFQRLSCSGSRMTWRRRQAPRRIGHQSIASGNRHGGGRESPRRPPRWPLSEIFSAFLRWNLFFKFFFYVSWNKYSPVWDFFFFFLFFFLSPPKKI